jgi:hypothetical protein
MPQNAHGYDLIGNPIKTYIEGCWNETDGVANIAVLWKISKFITFSRAACSVTMPRRTSSLCAIVATNKFIFPSRAKLVGYSRQTPLAVTF